MPGSFGDIATFWRGSKVLICWRYQRFCKAFIHEIFADSSKGVCLVICLQYLQNVRAQDIWFLLMVSAILAKYGYSQYIFNPRHSVKGIESWPKNQSIIEFRFFLFF